MSIAKPLAQTRASRRAGSPELALVAAVVGFFVVTLDAVVVNLALPPIRRSLGGGIADLQWVVNGYTLFFAALLLSGGSLADRFGARPALAWAWSPSRWPRWRATSGAFNTSRQIGGALSVAVFGARLADAGRFTVGVVTSLFATAAVLLTTTFACLRLPQR